MFGRNLLPFLVAIIFIVFFTYPADSFHTSKISSELSEKSINAPESSARVIIKIKTAENKGFSAKSAQIKESSKTEELLKNKKTLKSGGASEFVAATISMQDLEILDSDSRVESISEDRKMHAFLSESIPLISADSVWQRQIEGINVTGAGTSICIIDTGVDYTHPDLGGCFGEGCKVISGYDFVNSDEDPMDDNGHGTHVSGIVAANGTLKGVAPDAKIIAVKALNASGSGNESDVLAGIYWCISNATKYNISVISMSLGDDEIYSGYCDNESADNAFFAEAINTAITKNISVVVATGNNGAFAGISSPACITNATRVGASIKTPENIARFTNRGTGFPDMLLAPGVGIYSAYNNSGYVSLGGTSMATPHVSSAIALLSQGYRTIYDTSETPQYFEDLLNSTGKQINDAGGTNLNFSRIDVLAAYNMIVSNVSETTVTINSPQNGSFVNSNYSTINASQTANSQMDFSVDEKRTVSACSMCSSFVNSSGFLEDGLHNITVYGRNIAGAINYATAYFTVDTVLPGILFENTSTENNSIIDKPWIFANSSITENNFANATLSLFNSSSIINSAAIDDKNQSINWTNLSEGIYFFNATVFDAAGNSNSTETRKVTIDLMPPNITNITFYPIDAHTGENITITYRITDISPPESEIIMTHHNISEPVNVSHAEENYSAVFANITDAGEYNIAIFAKDAVNRTSNASKTFFVNVSELLSVNSNESKSCGNENIDAGETCTSCPEDAGACPAPPPQTQEKPASTSSSGGGSGGWGSGIIIPKKNITVRTTNTSVSVNESAKNISVTGNTSFKADNPPITKNNVTEKLAPPEIKTGLGESENIPETNEPIIVTGLSVSNYLEPVTSFIDWIIHLLMQLLD